tara:strand:- start:9642 stop:10994 length:1353 start_codon:yes stop_codon:yes gene_type:complete
MVNKKIMLVALAFFLTSKLASMEENIMKNDISKIKEMAFGENDAMNKLAELCLSIGHRLSGSKGLEEAVAWGRKSFEDEGIESFLQEVMVPHWERNEESLFLVQPYLKKMSFLSFGGSVATLNNEGKVEPIVADVIVVNSVEELSPEVAGKIVLFNIPMPENSLEGYGAVSRFRYSGAIEAAKHGAVGALLRSITINSLNTPHTGGMGYSNEYKKIPYGAVTIEDAMAMAKMQEMNIPIRAQMKLSAKTYPDALSHNVIGEIKGSKYPDEVVIVSGHLDAWDVGHGAFDDGAGVVHAMETLSIIKRLGLKPKRTIRAILWTNEENGARGGTEYSKEYGANTFAAIESDLGAEKPNGWVAEGNNAQKEMLESILAGTGLDLIGEGSGVDIGPMREHGVLLIGLRNIGVRYFDYHHAPSDTLDKIDENEFKEGLAHIAALTWSLANVETPEN